MNSILDSLRLVARDSLLQLLNSRLFPRAARSRAWSVIGHNVASSALINPNCFLGALSGLTLGRHTFVNYGCFFDLAAPTVIGERCDIGYEVMFITSTHKVATPHRRAGEITPSPIVVGDGVWIGARVTILPGVTIGSGCVIASGAVVVNDCQPDGVYAGVPARRVRTLAGPGEATEFSSALSARDEPASQSETRA